jgi:DNA polymerase III epsilon subunit-like protein
MRKPFDDNVIFFDTEFSSLDTDKGEILSLGMVKRSGEELYLEFGFNGEADAWPRENILPYLKAPKVSKLEAVRRIREFIGPDKPYVVAYVNQFDMIYLYKLFGLENFNAEFEWIPIDFASILFDRGFDPRALVERPEGFFTALGIDAVRFEQHNALDDAKLLKEVYARMTDGER